MKKGEFSGREYLIVIKMSRKMTKIQQWKGAQSEV